jgi:hypothetical protein
MTDQFNIDRITVVSQENVMPDPGNVNYVPYYIRKIASSTKKYDQSVFNFMTI